MDIGMLGTGGVGQQIASRLVELGHAVKMGGRTDEKARAWADGAGERASAGTFRDAAEHGAIVFNCTAGAHTMSALEQAGPDALRGKVLVDLANPLDFSKGFPPRLTVCNDDSLGEQIQRAYPATRVVKALNTMAHAVMVDPRQLAEDTVVFVCGDDAGAKGEVGALLKEMGWRDEELLDLGGIDAARGTEAWLLLWTRIYGATKDGTFNVRLSRPG